ncbi:hypothetical protein [Alicyclobacillus acidiphilus]|uniref:hypothetical protein n=1 Tax=Alicyclobacillus acidiphilus TaxID=182455 RepID=UPI0008368548|nr:hypothetical protein [Alicyclobacillus acidiphilus]
MSVMSIGQSANSFFKSVQQLSQNQQSASNQAASDPDHDGDTDTPGTIDNDSSPSGTGLFINTKA